MLNQLSEPLTELKANIDAVKRRTGFDVIKENYQGETESQSFSDESRGRSDSSGSPSFDDKEEEVCYYLSSASDNVKSGYVKSTHQLTLI